MPETEVDPPAKSYPYGRTYCLTCDGWADEHKPGCALEKRLLPPEKSD